MVHRSGHPAPSSCGCGPHDADELSHYSAGTSDVEFLFPWGWDELEGIANRGDYDLTQHADHSGERLEYFDQATNERYVPHVIEPAAGATRTMAAFLLAAYDEDEIGGETRTVLRLHPRLAPYKVAVLPLSKKEPLTQLSHEVAAMLRPRYMVDYDETQSIGRRYRRQDEIGTPLCVTVDFESIEDQAVTIRDRDSTEQVRVPIDDLCSKRRGAPRRSRADRHRQASAGVSGRASLRLHGPTKLERRFAGRTPVPAGARPRRQATRPQAGGACPEPAPAASGPSRSAGRAHVYAFDHKHRRPRWR